MNHLSSPSSAARALGGRLGWPLLLGLIVLAAGACSPAAAQVPTPEDFLGRPVGEDGHLFEWQEILGYFQAVDEQSDRLHLEVLGKSTLNQPFVLAVIGDAETVTQRDRYRQRVRTLYAAAGEDDGEDRARRAAAGGKVFVALSLGLHSNEVGASQASMEMLYDLVTREDPVTQHIRENVLVLMVPSMNPDGLDIVTRWYNQTVDTEAEGSFPPELYHHYAGHDNNRDGFFNRLRETRLWSQVLYHDWMPQIILDEHQMGSGGPRLFLPPFDDPVSPSVHPLVFTQLSAAGQHMVSELTAQGHAGIATSTIFTAEWPGSVRSTGFWHNMLGILSEVASAQFATPLYFPPGSLRGGGRGLPEYERRTNFVAPWEGGWWRLRDIIDLEKDLTWSLLGWAATQREALLLNFYRMNADAVAQGRAEAPYGFVIPRSQHDEGSAYRLVRLLQEGGVEVRLQPEAFTVEGVHHAEGGFVVLAAQPFRPFLLEMLDSPPYPMVRESGSDRFIRPYDVTAWNLPALLGVEVQSLKQPWAGDVPALLEEPADPHGAAAAGLPVVGPGQLDPKARWMRLAGTSNASFRVVFPLLRDDRVVRRVVEDGQRVRAGDFLVMPKADLVDRCARVGARFETLDESPVASVPLRSPRVGLFAPWGGSKDEGWTRWVLHHHGIAVKRLRAADIREDKLRRLKGRLDVIVIPSIGRKILEDGNSYGQRRNAYSPLWPEEYRAALGTEDAGRALLRFVESGGTVVAFDDSTPWVVENLGLPVRIGLDDLDRDAFYAPGTLVRARVETSHPLAWGMPDEVAVYFASGRGFRPIAWKRPTLVPVRYADDDLQVAGFLVGEDHMAGLPAMVDVPVGNGHVVLFGFKPQHRGQTEATFKLLLNALLRQEG